LIEKQEDKENKSLMAKAFGVSRSAIYYRSKKLAKDWELKTKIEKVLTDDPSYGYRRVADALHINKKKAQRVMKLFGMKAYRRRGRKPRKKGVTKSESHLGFRLHLHTISEQVCLFGYGYGFIHNSKFI